MKKLKNSDGSNQGLLSSLKLQENPFSVPKDYFNNLNQDILKKKNILETTQKAWLTPPNYQTDLTNDILMRVSEEKLKATISQDGFTIPDQYFETLQSAILNRTCQKSSEIISIERPNRSAWIRYASAACIALAASVFAFFQLKDREDAKPQSVQVENIIDKIPADDIISYLAFYSETGDYLILSEELSKEPDDFKESLSSEEIESYLENSI